MPDWHTGGTYHAVCGQRVDPVRRTFATDHDHAALGAALLGAGDHETPYSFEEGEAPVA